MTTERRDAAQDEGKVRLFREVEHDHELRRFQWETFRGCGLAVSYDLGSLIVIVGPFLFEWEVRRAA